MAHLPDFLVIGVGKAGTHSIYEYLRQHPSISLTRKKETHFFVCDRASEAVPEGFEKQAFTDRIDNLDDYLREFDAKPGATVYGEVCPSYYYYPNAARNIKKYIPGVKLICILRNPVDRLFSNFTYGSDNNNASQFAEKLENYFENPLEDPRFARWVDNGNYFKSLQVYFDLFPRENIKIFLYEELSSYPRKLMRELLEFIGLMDFEFDTSQRFNVSGKVKLKWLKKLIKKFKLSAKLRSILPVPVYQKLRVFTEKAITDKKDTIPAGSLKKLQDFYRSDLLKLQELLNLDLSAWLS